MDYHFHIAALGASAGGVKALKDFFSAAKDASNIAYVVSLHSQRNYQSNLVSILSRVTSIPVVEIQQGMQIEPNRIFLPPPIMKVSLKDHHFLLTERPVLEVVNKTINFMFESAAAEAREKLIGIIMSGTGSDGTAGFHAIEKAKGITIVQDPATAEFDGMPNSSIKFDHPTYILHPSEMPAVVEQIASGAIETSRLNQKVRISPGLHQQHFRSNR